MSSLGTTGRVRTGDGGWRVSQVVAVAPALPEHRLPQAEITDAFAEVVLPAGTDRAVLDRLHQATGVTHRHLALPLDDYAGLAGFGAANDAFIEVGTEARRPGRRRRAGHGRARSPTDVDVLVTTSVTGIAAPSLDARLVPVLGPAPGRPPDPGVRARLRRRRRRGRPGARPPARRPGRGRGPAVGRAVLADRAAGRRLDGQPRRQRAVRRRRRGRGHGGGAAGRSGSACPVRRWSPPAAGSTRTPSG